MGLLISGAGATQILDSSGESIDIKGLDISSLVEGMAPANFEHRGPESQGASAIDIVGAIKYAKKIFSEDDCATEDERKFWAQIENPFLYLQVELFDAEDHEGAKALAAIIRYYHRRQLPIMVRFSIEGSTLARDPRDKNIIRQCVARAVALTVKPANRSAYTGVLADPQDDQNPAPRETLLRFEDPTRERLSSFEFEFRSELSPEEVLKNSLEDMREISALSKVISAGGYNAAPTTLTGGSALQKEHVDHKVKPQILAAIRDWDRRQPFKAFLKSRLPDASDGFLQHFSDIVDDMNAKKAEALESDLQKAFQPLTKADPLTVDGKSVKPIPSLGSSFKFDESQGILYTPRGKFSLQAPSRDPDPGKRQEFQDKLGDDRVSGLHGHAMAHWGRLHELAADHGVPKAVVQHVIAYTGMHPDDHHALADIVHRHGADARSAVPEVMTSGLGPREARYALGMMGGGNVLPLDSHLTQQIFGLKDGDHGALAYLKSVLNDGKQTPLADAVDRHYGRHHDAVHHLREHQKYGHLFESDPEQAILPAALKHWAATSPDFKPEAVEPASPKMLKSEDDLPQRTARLHHEWAQKYGDVPALMMYHAYLVPQLLHHHEHEKVQKMEALTARLVKAAGTEAPEIKPKDPGFQGSQVSPGKIEVTAGPHRGHVMDFLGADDKHFFVRSPGESELKKLPRTGEKKQFHVSSWFQNQDKPGIIDAQEHGIGYLNHRPEQHQLIHGINMEAVTPFKGMPSMTEDHARGLGVPMGWTRNAAGQSVFVKPDAYLDDGDPGLMSGPHRDVAYRKSADEVFGMGAHVPEHAAFVDPKSGQHYTAVQGLIDANHVHRNTLEHDQLAARYHDGTLDKATLMDMMLANNDRHDGNYMMSSGTPDLHLIDHTLGLGFDDNEPAVPPTWYDRLTDHPTVGQHPMTAPLHPGAQAWLGSLDPEHFRSKLLESGVSRGATGKAVQRMKVLKNHVAANPQDSKKKIFDAFDQGRGANW